MQLGVQMSDTHGGLVLVGLERIVVFNHLRAAIGLRWELPRLLQGVSIPVGSRCLEIGTGMGWGTLGLIQRSPGMTAIASDYDSTVLPLARAYIEWYAPNTSVGFCCANAKAFPFPDGTFDLVLALYVLHHVAGYREALHDIRRVMKSGGRFVFIDVVRARLFPRLRELVPPDGLSSKEELTQFLLEAGFRIERWSGFPGLGLVVARATERTATCSSLRQSRLAVWYVFLSLTCEEIRRQPWLM
jgi:SAM-dependent methyltransferase